MQHRYSFILLLLLGGLLLGPAARAQRAPGGAGTNVVLPPVTTCPSVETPWSHLIDSLTAPLSRNGITTGLLYDRDGTFPQPACLTP